MSHDHTQMFDLASEREALESFLDAQREGLIRKIDGLDDAMARQAPTASSLSLLGLVKHSATWECRWFQVVMGGRESPDGWPEVYTRAPGRRHGGRRERHGGLLGRALPGADRAVEGCRGVDGSRHSMRADRHHRVQRA